MIKLSTLIIMKISTLTILLFAFSLSVVAQDLPGFKTSSYNGVLGVFNNPANAAQNNYRWDFNLFSANINVGNNNASFNLKKLGEITQSDSLINQLIGTEGKASNGLLGVEAKVHHY